jgi:hypothetical protein
MTFVLLGVPAMSEAARGGAPTTPKVHGPKASTLKASTGAATKSSTTKVKGASATAKTTTTKGAATKSAKSTTPQQASSATTKTKGGAKTATASGATTPSDATSVSTATSTTSTTGTGTWTPDSDNPVAMKLSTKSNIMQKAQTVIGADVDLNDATSGFKNFGQFVAAVNVSNNHNIAFADLKAAMTGLDIDGQPVTTTSTTGTTTGTTTMSLGQAIQKLKTGVDGDTVAENALVQAEAEINSSPTSTSSSTTTTKAKSKSR